MSVVALSAASVFISDPQFLNGVGVPVIASAGSLLTGNTGFTFPWAQGIMVYYVGATSNTTTLTMVNPNNAALNVTTASLAQALAFMFGPIPSTFCNGSTGLVSVNVTGLITGARAGVYLMPNFTGGYHSPFDMTVSGVSDY